MEKCHDWTKGLAIGLLLIPSLCSATDIFIFKPSKEKASVVQETIQKQCNGVTVTVFGRVNDFMEQIELKKPAAIISLLPVVDSYKPYNVMSKGLLGGQTHDQYVWVSLGKPVDLAAIATLKIGVIDILGRKGMDAYMAQLLGTDVTLKRVTKTEDLIPLLTFNAVDAILVSSGTFDELKQTSQLDFVVTKTELKVGLSTVATIEASEQSKIKSCISSFSKEINDMLGVEKWTF
jgi:hypothetical protein